MDSFISRHSEGLKVTKKNEGINNVQKTTNEQATNKQTNNFYIRTAKQRAAAMGEAGWKSYRNLL